MRLAYFYDLPMPCRLAAPIQILRTAHALAGLGVQTQVYVGPMSDSPEACLAYYGLEPHERLTLRAFYRPKDRSRDRRARLRELLADQQDGLVVMSRGEPGAALFADVKQALPRARFVLESHRVGPAEVSKAGGWLARKRTELRHAADERRAVEGADGLVCLTPGVRDALIERYAVDGKPCLILPSGVEVADPPASDGRARDIDVLYVGKFDDRKGVEQLLAAMPALEPYTLWLVGGRVDQQEAMRERARAIGVADRRLEMPGYVEPGQVGDYYRRARVGVCPLPGGVSAVADRFTSPMKVLEMMVHGAAIVASDLPTTRNILEHERNALLVPPNDPRALASAARRLLEEPATAQRLREQARVDVQPYAWPNRARLLRDFLGTLA